MKTKQLGFFACMVAVVLVVGLSSGTIYGKDKSKEHSVVIFDCDSFGVVPTSIDSNLDPLSPLSDKPSDIEPPTLADLPESCSQAIAFLLTYKFKVEGTHGGQGFVGAPLIKGYTFVRK